MPRSRFSVSLYVLAIFFSGVLVGGASYRLYSLKTVVTSAPGARPQRSPEEWRQHYVDDMRTQLKLDERQTARLQQILDETRAKFKQFRDRTQPEAEAIQANQVTQINAMLTDAQKPVYEQWRLEREKQRRRFGNKKK